MKSALYECQVMHARFLPRAHRFVYRIFLFAIDLDELPTLPQQLALFSVGGRNVYSFRDNDYLPTSEPLHQPSGALAPASWIAGDGPTSTNIPPLKQRVAAYLAQHGVTLGGGRVILVTLPRVLGYGFNPVSFYFCYDAAGRPLAAIAEVTNTFREVKPYFLGPESRSDASGAFRIRVPKHFYVSPFSDVDVAFDFTLRTLDDRLSIQIDDYASGDRTLTSTLHGSRHALTSTRLAWFTVKYPLVTLRMISLIHLHALRLWLKRVPWFAKGARARDQRDLYRPHGSLTTDAPQVLPSPSQALGTTDSA